MRIAFAEPKGEIYAGSLESVALDISAVKTSENDFEKCLYPLSVLLDLPKISSASTVESEFWGWTKVLSPSHRDPVILLGKCPKMDRILV